MVQGKNKGEIDSVLN